MTEEWGVEKNRADLFFFKRKGGSFTLPPHFSPLLASVFASQSNLYNASPGNQPDNLIEIPLLLTGNQARTLCHC